MITKGDILKILALISLLVLLLGALGEAYGQMIIRRAGAPPPASVDYAPPLAHPNIGYEGMGLSVASQSPLSISPLNRDLVAWYLALPGVGGTEFRDLMRVHHGTVTGTGAVAALYTTAGGRPGGFGAFLFDNSSHYVDLGSPDGLDNFFAGGATITFWAAVKSAGGSQKTMLDKAVKVNINIGNGADQIVLNRAFSSVWGQWVATSSSVSTTWTHVAIVYNSDSVDNDPVIYYNGVPSTIVETAAPSGTATSDASDNFHLGRRTSGVFEFPGRLDDLRFFKRSLTQADITMILDDSRRGYPQALNHTN